MVERRHWFSDAIPHIVLCLGVLILAFPVWLAIVASTWDAGTIANGTMPLTPGPFGPENYSRTLLAGARSAGEPVGRMLFNSFVMAMAIALGKISISIISAYAVVYFRFPFRMA